MGFNVVKAGIRLSLKGSHFLAKTEKANQLTAEFATPIMVSSLVVIVVGVVGVVGVVVVVIVAIVIGIVVGVTVSRHFRLVWAINQSVILWVSFVVTER